MKVLQSNVFQDVLKADNGSSQQRWRAQTKEKESRKRRKKMRRREIPYVRPTTPRSPLLNTHVIAAHSDVIFLFVLLHPFSGTLFVVRLGGVLIDVKTSKPSLTQNLRCRRIKGCHSINASIYKDNCGAKNGTLAIFASGEESMVKRLKPLFRRAKVVVEGLVGSGGDV
ncbi:hypothetical protein JHK84_055728 [Glycine max]|nr:hypothetical protein JHK86_055685 [Glycine max]KAG5074497.1 hypothetical protein JHK84_055728 [Glycine max]